MVFDAAAVAVLLAAGGGTRFAGDGHKLTATLPATPTRPSESVAQRALAQVTAAGFSRIIVVTGRLDAEDLGIDTDHSSPIRIAHNADWDDGQATSLSAGLAAAERAGARVAAVGLADQPGASPEAWSAVAAAATAQTPIAVATYDSRRANPVGLHHTIWKAIPTTGDAGARTVMRIHPELVVEVPCPGSPDDIDTEEDLRRWQSS